jgi:hypothetical protein
MTILNHEFGAGGKQLLFKTGWMEYFDGQLVYI